MRTVLLILCVLAMPSIAFSQTCDISKSAITADERAPLFDKLKVAENESDAQAQALLIWKIWHIAPDPKSQELLDLGKRRINESKYAEAERLLSDLIAYCPDYPEGWNQRAFARFLDGDLEGSLADLDRTLELEPNHFAALAGRGLTLLRQGRDVLAHQAIREAMAIHPWLSERHLLPPSEKI